MYLLEQKILRFHTNIIIFCSFLICFHFQEMFVLLSDIKSCANYVVIIWIWSPRRSNDMTHNMSVLEWLWMSWKSLHEFDVLSLLLLLWFREEAEPCADMKDWISWFSFRDIFSLAEGVPDWSKVLSSILWSPDSLLLFSAENITMIRYANLLWVEPFSYSNV